MVKQILRKLLDESLTSNECLTIFINNIKYSVYHGRIICKRTKKEIISDREILFEETLNIYR